MTAAAALTEHRRHLADLARAVARPELVGPYAAAVPSTARAQPWDATRVRLLAPVLGSDARVSVRPTTEPWTVTVPGTVTGSLTLTPAPLVGCSVDVAPVVVPVGVRALWRGPRWTVDGALCADLLAALAYVVREAAAWPWPVGERSAAALLALGSAADRADAAGLPTLTYAAGVWRASWWTGPRSAPLVEGSSAVTSAYTWAAADPWTLAPA